jgi:hypothetical protein
MRGSKKKRPEHEVAAEIVKAFSHGDGAAVRCLRDENFSAYRRARAGLSIERALLLDRMVEW